MYNGVQWLQRSPKLTSVDFSMDLNEVYNLFYIHWHTRRLYESDGRHDAIQNVTEAWLRCAEYCILQNLVFIL